MCDRAAVHDLATCRFIDEKGDRVLIAEPRGTGKSHLAQSVGHAAARQGYDVLLITPTQLMASLHTPQAMGTYERRLQYRSKVALLIIDDFGLNRSGDRRGHLGPRTPWRIQART